MNGPPELRAELRTNARTRSAILLISLVYAAFLAGCAHKRAREVSGATERIAKIEVEGNAEVSEEDIEAHMNLRETTWFPLPKRQYLHRGMLPVDADRIEELYAARGFHDAEVLDIEVTSHRGKDDVVDLRVKVEENAPTTIETVEFAWPKGPPQDAVAAPKTIESTCGLTKGEPFDVDAMHRARAVMENALEQHGYAFAEVSEHAEVDRVAHVAHVRFELVSGPVVDIGNVTIEGLSAVPEKPVRVEFKRHLGKRYSPRRIESIEQSIYALGVFESVVVREAEAPRDGKVDLTISVTESRPQLIRLGVGLELEPNRWEQHGRMIYSHANLWRTLTQLDVELKAGYAELPALYNPKQHGPVLDLEPVLRKKGLLEDQLVWTLEPGFELGIQEGYQFYAPTNRVGVSRFFTRFFELGLSHNLRFVDFFSVDPALDASRSILGLDFRDPYLVSYMELQPRLHLTDRLVDPQNGVELGVIYSMAGGIFGGQYDFNKVTPEIVGRWTPLKNRLQFATRGQLGFILPFGDEPGAPIDLKYYLGGASTVRGWGLRRLSPRVEYCPPGSDGCRTIPVGGNTSILMNFETRVRIWKGLWGVAFVDGGDVQADESTFHPTQWNYSAGPGVRYVSRIGTFRVDVGIRINDPERFSDQPRAALHFGLGEAF